MSNVSRQMPPLTHYTSSLHALQGICTYGFAWVQNSRRLSETLLGHRDSWRREPQQFGMVSFTELAPCETANHLRRFGQFGIVVSEQWAVKNNAQRVFYVPETGPQVEALRLLFSAGLQELEQKLPTAERQWPMPFENRAVAATIAGASLWRTLLTLWEYFEPEESAAQREWRVVNPEPDYSVFGTKAETIAAVSPPMNWAKHTRVVPIQPREVVAFVCPQSLVESTRIALPPPFQAVRFEPTDG